MVFIVSLAEVWVTDNLNVPKFCTKDSLLMKSMAIMKRFLVFDNGDTGEATKENEFVVGNVG